MTAIGRLFSRLSYPGQVFLMAAVPLVLAMLGFGLLFLALVVYRTGTEIRLRRTAALRARMNRGA